MKIYKSTILNILLPCIVLSFLSQGMKYIGFISNIPVSWSLLMALLSYLLWRSSLLKPLNPLLFFAFSLYMAWCILTTVWSEVPPLSLIKAFAFLIVAVVMLSAGGEWVARYGFKKSLGMFGLIATVGMFTAIASYKDTSNTVNIITGVTAYRGWEHNPNMFGSLMAMILPFLLWNLYQNWGIRRRRNILFILVILNVYFLVRSLSRAAFLVDVMIFTFFLLSLNVKKKLLISFLGVILISGLLAFFGNRLIRIIAPYIYKVPQISNISLYHSRQTVWRDSYDAANKGGLIGGGYGVSLQNKNANFMHSKFLPSLPYYAREKGNSQLAIIEETGLIGFLLYCFLLSVFFFQAISFWNTLQGKQKVLVGILIGAELGMLVQSIFEAWWVGPDGPENIYFWTLFGVIGELMRSYNKKIN